MGNSNIKEADIDSTCKNPNPRYEIKDTEDELQHIEQKLKETDPKMNKNLDFEIWYPIIKDHTMETELIQLTLVEAMAICPCICERDEQQSILLNNLANKYDQIIAKMSKDNGVFVRYSHRSPKDAVFSVDPDDFKERLKQKSKEIYVIDSNINDIKNTFTKNQIICNSVLRAFVLVASDLQCVKTGAKALKYASNSARILRDLKCGELQCELDYGDEFAPFAIIRKFYHNLDFESEFRCFVLNGKLNVVGQYHSKCYVHKLKNNKDEIKMSILKYWEEIVHPKMKDSGYVSYVVDLALLIEGDKGNEEEKNENDGCGYKWIVVEFNPMGTNCDAGLYDWVKDCDLFFEEKTSFRIREEMLDGKPDKYGGAANPIWNAAVEYLKQEFVEEK